MIRGGCLAALIAVIASPAWTQTVLSTDGDVEAQGFVGNGSRLADIDGTNITSGIVSEARIDSLLARDSELVSAVEQLAARLESRLGLRGSSLWLLPDWYQGNELGWFTTVSVTYLGSAPGTFVSCRWFQSGTSVLEQLNMWVGPGGQGFCNTQSLGSLGSGWMVVESDEPVFAVASRLREKTSINDPVYVAWAFARSLPMIPVDCTAPEGYEFVCSTLAE